MITTTNTGASATETGSGHHTGHHSGEGSDNGSGSASETGTGSGNESGSESAPSASTGAAHPMVTVGSGAVGALGLAALMVL